MADHDIELSPETQRLAELGKNPDAGFGGDPLAKPAPAPDTGAPAADAPAVKARPDDVPENFWDPEKGEVRTDALLKSYRELHAQFSRDKQKGAADKPQIGADPAPSADEGEPSGSPEKGKPEAASAGEFQTLFAAAEAQWAESGELTSEMRADIVKAGIPEAVLDNYLVGVKAASEALTRAVYEAAGGEETYKAAVEWAKDNWSLEQIEAYDAAIGGPLSTQTVKALVADYAASVGTEGRLTQPGQPAGSSDLYRDPAEFVKDLAAADAAGDALARQAAVQKLERSKKAGSIKHVTPRTGLSQF